MTIVKKLFFMTVLGLAINEQLSASEPQPDATKLLNIADNLQRIPNTEPMTIAQWIRTKYNSIYAQDKETTEKLLNIANSENSPTEKTKAIKNLWQEETAPKKSEDYFSSMSNMAKAAVALVVTASIASYFYFMHPWAKTAAE
jgi:hypothetical protein